MARYRIEFEREKCIGTTACNEAYPENWQIQPDGKSSFKVGEFGEEALEKNMAAAKGCPVTAIHIINIDTNKRLI